MSCQEGHVKMKASLNGHAETERALPEVPFSKRIFTQVSANEDTTRWRNIGQAGGAMSPASPPAADISIGYV